MKKSTLEKLAAYLNTVTSSDIDFLTMRDEINAEFAKTIEKAHENRTLYDTAKDMVITYLAGLGAPATLTQIYDEAELPEGFTRGKLSYGLRAYWTDVIRTNLNGRAVNTYELIS